MFRGSVVFRIIFLLLVLGALIGGACLLYRVGFTHGFNAAALTANPASTAISPDREFGHMEYGHMTFGPGRGMGFGRTGLGLLFGIGGFFLVLFIIGSFFRMMFWRHWEGGPGPHELHHHHRHGHWAWNWDEQPDPIAEPGAGAGGNPNPK